MLKVVLDTNQFVSSLLVKKGYPAHLLQAWKEHTYILITSRQIIEEIESLINLIEHEAVVLPGSSIIDVIKEDSDDNMILACALEAKAQYIVSGDKHLLNLRKYKDISIVTVREFLKVIGHLSV